MADVARYTYAERLATFRLFWTDNQAAAHQLAAIGHIYDRPPLEELEHGSRCISCSAFVKKESSVKALESSCRHSSAYEKGFESFNFHHPSCIRLQVRIPLDPQAVFPGLHGGRFNELRRRFEGDNRRSDAGVTRSQRASQKSSLFTLPAELRLEIYRSILPTLDPETEILQLHRDSARVITSAGYHKAAARNTSALNVLRTCRAVNDEAMDLLYAHTTFTFASTKVLYLFLRSIGKPGRDLVKAVDVHCGGREDAIAFALLACCGSLRSICIRLPRPMLLFSRAPIWVVDGMSCLLALSGVEEVRFGGCASALNGMSDAQPDAAVVRKELTRLKGVPTVTDYLERYLDTAS